MTPSIQGRGERLSEVDRAQGDPDMGGEHRGFPRRLGVSQSESAARRRISRELAMFKRGGARAVELFDVDAAARGARLRRILVTADLAALAMAAAAASLIVGGLGMALGTNEQILTLALLSPIFFLLAHTHGLYHLADRHLDYTLAEELGPTFSTVSVWCFAVTLGSAALGAGSDDMAWVAFLWIGLMGAVLFNRAIVRRFTRNADWFRQKVMLVGDPVGIERVLRRIKRHPECGLDPRGRIHRTSSGLEAFYTNEEGRRVELGHRPGNSAAEVLELLREADVERVVVTGWGEALAERTELIRLLAMAGVYVDVVSGEPEALMAGGTIHQLEGLSIMTVRPPQMTRLGKFSKRALDVAAASLGLLVTAPLLAYAAVRIKLDSEGPVFFRQKRCGAGGETFDVLKLRTMVSDAEDQKERLRDESQTGNLFKLREDPRITPFGRKIRKRSVDELPQLWNVLRGDMSLVGPRPLPPDEARLAVDHFADRNHVRPGITGPWQIHGRSDIPFDDMVKLDYSYVSTWSLQEDLRLMIRTVGVVLGGRGAY